MSPDSGEATIWSLVRAETVRLPALPAVRASDAGLTIANLGPLDDYVAAHVADRRFALMRGPSFACETP
jgi:hypothetical protein